MVARPLPVVRAWVWWLGFFGMVVLALSLTAWAYMVGLPPLFATNFDKVAHFGMAGLLAFFLDGALRRRRLFALGPVAVPLAALLVLLPSGIDEILQRFATLRRSSIWDFAADVAGVIVLIPLSRRIAQ